MAAVSGSDGMLKKLLEANTKTQQSVSQVVSSIKELVNALKEAGEAPEMEMEKPAEKELKVKEKETVKGDNLAAINAKVDTLLEQHGQLIAAVSELTRILKHTVTQGPATQQPLAPPPMPPPQYRRL